MKNILVSGATGQLGQELNELVHDYPKFNFDLKSRPELDLENELSIKNALQDKQYDYFINAGAYTAVDKAESDKASAYAINGMALFHIANYIPKDCTLIHISTDYVYHINKSTPLQESDSCHPKGVYALSKLQGEQFVNSMIPRSIILRTSWVYSRYGKNFVKTMLRLGKEKEELSIVNDEIGTPTYAKNIANSIMSIINGLEQKPHTEAQYGIYNYSDENYTNWADFARYIFSVANINCKVSDISSENYGAAAKRPTWSVLSKEKIKKDYGIIPPSWQESIQECLQLIE
ncbi:dTDP-4-dehydrorhamnose reductase [Saprospiraceae bacterium]|nr:dTDP-4-dehydrorhamnose reductase [Saprospiraceae bacterium]